MEKDKVMRWLWPMTALTLLCVLLFITFRVNQLLMDISHVEEGRPGFLLEERKGVRKTLHRVQSTLEEVEGMAHAFTVTSQKVTEKMDRVEQEMGRRPVMLVQAAIELMLFLKYAAAAFIFFYVIFGVTQLTMTRS